MMENTRLNPYLQSPDINITYVVKTQCWPAKIHVWTQHLAPLEIGPLTTEPKQNNKKEIQSRILAAIHPLTKLHEVVAATPRNGIVRCFYPISLCQLTRVVRLCGVGDSTLHYVDTALPRVPISFLESHPELVIEPPLGKTLLLSGWRRAESSDEWIRSQPFASHHDGVISKAYTNSENPHSQFAPSFEEFSSGSEAEDSDAEEGDVADSGSSLDSSGNDSRSENGVSEESSQGLALKMTAQRSFFSKPIGLPDILPTLIVAFLDDLIPQLAGALYHRWVLNVKDPMFGIALEPSSTIARIVFAWVEDETCDDGQLPTVQIALAPTQETQSDPALGIFNLADQTSVLALVQFFFRSRDRMTTLGKKVSRSSSKSYSNLDWRANSTHEAVLEIDTSVKTNEIDGRVRSWRSGVVAENPTPTVGPNSRALQSNRSGQKLSGQDVGPRNDLDLPLEPECDQDRWLFMRIAHGILRLKSSGCENVELEDEVNGIIDIYNEMSQIYWPQGWASRESLPPVDIGLEQVRQSFWEQYQERSQKESIKDAPDHIATHIFESFNQLLHVPNDAQPSPRGKRGRVLSWLRALISPDQWLTLLYLMLEIPPHHGPGKPLVITECEVNLARNECLAQMLSLSTKTKLDHKSLQEFHHNYPAILRRIRMLLMHLSRTARDPQEEEEADDQMLYRASLRSEQDKRIDKPTHAGLNLIHEGRVEPTKGMCNAIACVSIPDAFTPAVIETFGSRSAFETFLDSFVLITSHDNGPGRLSNLQTQGATRSDEAEPTISNAELLLPVLIIEVCGHPFRREDRERTGTQTKIFSTSAVRFLFAVGIKDYPVFHLTIDGGIGVLGMTWYSSKQEGILYTERKLVIYDISDPFSVYHLAVTLLQLRQRFEVLAQAFEKVKDDFLLKVSDPERRKDLEWSQRAQRGQHSGEMDNVEKVIEENCGMR
ncbi:hypothetical protein BDN72DRAFT_959637 [Pluteus cervinus]|uniref:Uncharacterized protein n=1 Tax=Pluteus cervinus TaxID=181527 RepID=A0ACD3AUV3_9AGAR|nr:hypothetical protein BDN72DRAFT_959637 [Pluteus cervinus]